MDNSRVKATSFFIEKISFSLKLFSDHFYGQSFIKTVQGPLVEMYHEKLFREFRVCIKTAVKKKLINLNNM